MNQDGLFTPSSGTTPRYMPSKKTGLIIGIAAISVVIIVVVIVLSIYLTKKNATSSVASSAAASIAASSESGGARFIPAAKKPQAQGPILKGTVSGADTASSYISYVPMDDSEDEEASAGGFLPLGDDNDMALLA